MFETADIWYNNDIVSYRFKEGGNPLYGVLIVDDEYEIRRGISTFFPWEMLGFKVVGQADNGKKALDMILKDTIKIDVLLTDVKMPVMDGIELTRQVREIRQDIIVIFLSAYSDFEYARDALKLGVHDYILKPTEYDKLINVFTKLKAYLENRELSRQNGSKEALPGSDALNYRGKVIQTIKKYLNTHFADASLESAAKFVNFSPSYLSTVFKEETGTNFSDYLIAIRMKKAAMFLDDINYKTHEVSELVGYSNPKNFARTFKKYYGVSPREYRK